MNKFTYADLFCGSGGLSLGFENAGFDCVFAIDSDKSATTTFGYNIKDNVQTYEITEETHIPKVDLVIGGPPCQGFSSAGFRRADDNRNTLVRVFAEIIAKSKPKAFVFENVEGFLTTDSGNRVFDLLDPLIKSGYYIHLRKINAANFGIPQHRKRVIAIGGLGWEPNFIEPTHSARGAPGTSKIYRHLRPCPSIIDAFSGLPSPSLSPPGNPEGHHYKLLSEQIRERVHHLKQGQTMKDLPHELWHDSYKKRAFRRVKDGTPTERRGGAPAGLRRLKADEPSKAITSGAISEFIHPYDDRNLTLRECARIQTFPDNFKFFGSTSDRILQIANAVPPLLAEIIANNILIDLKVINNQQNTSKGKLLSFIPTLSNGMSPILKELTLRIMRYYPGCNIKIGTEQIELWH